jgi:hypothetical protein
MKRKTKKHQTDSGVSSSRSEYIELNNTRHHGCWLGFQWDRPGIRPTQNPAHSTAAEHGRKPSPQHRARRARARAQYLSQRSRAGAVSLPVFSLFVLVSLSRRRCVPRGLPPFPGGAPGRGSGWPPTIPSPSTPPPTPTPTPTSPQVRRPASASPSRSRSPPWCLGLPANAALLAA